MGTYGNYVSGLLSALNYYESEGILPPLNKHLMHERTLELLVDYGFCLEHKIDYQKFTVDCNVGYGETTQKQIESLVSKYRKEH